MAVRLLKLGADVEGNGASLETTPLYCAVDSREVECAALLLEHGADTQWMIQHCPTIVGGRFDQPQPNAEFVHLLQQLPEHERMARMMVRRMVRRILWDIVLPTA